MNIQNFDAFERPEFILPFSGRVALKTRLPEKTPSTLTRQELQRIVADMID